MPLTRIALRTGKPAEYRKALTQGIQRALIETCKGPPDDIFMLINEHEAENFVFDRQYLGVERSDDLVIVQITFNNTRTIEPLLLLPKGMLPLALSPDGRHLAVSVDARRLQVWDLSEIRKKLHTFGLDWVD